MRLLSAFGTSKKLVTWIEHPIFEKSHATIVNGHSDKCSCICRGKKNKKILKEIVSNFSKSQKSG